MIIFFIFGRMQIIKENIMDNITKKSSTLRAEYAGIVILISAIVCSALYFAS